MIFQDETPRVLKEWNGHINFRNVKDRLDWKELTAPLPCGDTFIPAGYQWNGASSGPLRSVPIFGFPKWKHPIATCRHDYRCERVETRKQRKIADKLFKRDISLGQEHKKITTWWEMTKGYTGVRIGAFFTFLF